MPDGRKETATTAGCEDATMQRPEMVLVSREWAAERIRQFKDHERHSLQTWAWRMYRDLSEIVQFETAGESDPVYRWCDRCGSTYFLTSALNGRREPVWLCRHCIEALNEEAGRGE